MRTAPTWRVHQLAARAARPTDSGRVATSYNAFSKHFGVDKVTQCIGLAPRTVCTFADLANADSLLVRSIVQQEMIKREVLFLVGHSVSFAYSNEDVARCFTARALRCDV
jgi:hypothetical protein